MSCHNGHNTFVDQCFIYFAVGSIPLVAVKLIDAHDQMLVVFFCSIAWEVFHTGSKVLGLHSFEESLCIADNIIRIVIKSS